jgi:HK97 family phage major capsid protein
MKRKQKDRYKALLAKGDTLSDAEKTEFAGLKTVAEGAAFDPTKDDGSFTEEDFREAAAEALGAELTKSGLTADNIVAKLKAVSGTPITMAEIENVIKTQLGAGAKQVNLDDLVTKVKAAMPGNGVSKEDFTKAMDDLAKQFKTPSRMEHPEAYDIEFPIVTKSGNITVSSKQLLNVLLTSVTTEKTPRELQERLKANPNDGISDSQLKSAMAAGNRYMARVKGQLLSTQGKAITATGVGSGAELLAVDLSTDLQARLYMESEVARQMIGSEVDMPTNPFKFPMTTTRPVFYAGSEGGAQQTSTPGTQDIILTAAKLIAQVDYSYEADEDSLIAILPMLQQNLGLAAADALEDAILNGDTSMTHMDSDTAAITNAAAKLFPGIRKYCLSATPNPLTLDMSAGGINFQNTVALKKFLGKYGLKPQDLMIVTGTSTYNDYVGLPETLTLNVAGAAARIFTGMAPQILGIPIVPSARVRENVNAAGVFDGEVETQAVMYLIYKPAWILGVKRQFLVETWRDTRTQLNSVIASFRRALQPKELGTSGETLTVLGFNYQA